MAIKMAYQGTMVVTWHIHELNIFSTQVNLIKSICQDYIVETHKSEDRFY